MRRLPVRLVLTDAIWAKMKPFIKGRRQDPGATGRNNRLFVEAVLWMLRTGAPWRDLPTYFGKWNTVYRRFRRGCLTGVWQVLAVMLQTTKPLEPRMVLLDSTYVRVHQHASGAAGGGLVNGIGPSRGGRTTKLHIALSAHDELLAYTVTPGNIADITMAPELISHLHRAHYVIADKGYDCDRFVSALRAQGIRAVIPPRRKRVNRRRYSRPLYRERNRVERYFARLKHQRRLATRYDMTTVSYAGMLCAFEALRAARASAQKSA